VRPVWFYLWYGIAMVFGLAIFVLGLPVFVATGGRYRIAFPKIKIKV
jgi:hypothetical protein